MAYSYFETTVSALESAKRTVSGVDYYDLTYTNLDYTPLYSTTQVEADKYVSDVGDTLKVTLGVNELDRSSNTDLWIVNTTSSRVEINTSDSSWSSLTPQSTDLVRLTRVSKKDDQYVDYANASVLTEPDLDAQAKQSLHIVQESIDTANDALPLATDGKWDAKSKVIKNVFTPSVGTDAVNKTYADTVNDSVGAHRDDALDHRDTAESYATKINGVVQHFSSASDNTSGSGADQSGVYSSKEWAVGSHSGNTDGSSKQWALGGGTSFANGTAVSGSDYSAKEHAIGTTVTTGSSKQWATKDTSAVASSLYSAKEYASGDATGSGGSAKAWATDTSAPDGVSGSKSAKTWAGEAATSASTSESSAIVMGIALG